MAAYATYPDGNFNNHYVDPTMFASSSFPNQAQSVKAEHGDGDDKPYIDPALFSSAYMSTQSLSPHQDDEDDMEDGGADSSVGKWKGKTKLGDKERPVKAACLSCRSKKAKCDGQMPICGQCVKKNLECVYVKSRRGGARKKRELVAPSALKEFLARLDRLLQAGDLGVGQEMGPLTDDTTNIVREFTSREEILRCYYDEVHPFHALLPPRDKMHLVFPTILPNSPFLLACQTIMVLVPHPLDQNPKSANSKRLRRLTAQHLAKQAMEAVEHVLQHQSAHSLECVQALCLLGLWEWGSSGDLSATRARSGQAIGVAMELGLHELDKDRQNAQHGQGRQIEGEDWRLDMARRTWWTVYVHQIYSAIVSGAAPLVGPDDPRIKVDFPVVSVSDNAWPNWVNTVKQCSRVIALINAFYEGVPGSPTRWGNISGSGVSMTPAERQNMKSQLIEVDKTVTDMLKVAESTALVDFVPGGEELVCRNMQMATRFGLAVVHIQVHRQQAFPEVSLFSKKICGLPVAPGFGVDGADDASNNIMLAEAPGAVSTDRVQGWADPELDLSGLWEPETYPANLPPPWFATSNGAAAFVQNPQQVPNWGPTIDMRFATPGFNFDDQPGGAFISPISPSTHSATMSVDGGRRRSVSATPSAAVKPHKAWGVDDKDNTVRSKDIPAGSEDGLQVFPPGISLSRCALAAHTVVRLEVLHRSASIAITHEPPKWMPFCACGLVSGAYAFLLLALAVQAEATFGDKEERGEEVEALLTNVKILLAALESYGVMWDGIDAMAGEVRAALEAATRLPYEVRAQIESVSPASSGNALL